MKGGFSFEVRRKDAAGRLGRVRIGERELETPLILPVYNPGKPTIPIKQLVKEFNVQALMTNSYMLLKNAEFARAVKRKGVHKFLGFDGVIATDSGSFQLMAYGAVDTSNEEIVKFQNRIGSDIGSFLDIPTLPEAWKPRAEEQLRETIKRGKEAAKSAKFILNAGVQGGRFLDLRAKSAKAMSKISPLVAVGGIVQLMESYRFTELVDVIATVKQNIPTDRLVHAFGLGHPMVFPLAVLLGCDLFDSAAYALFAEDGRYLTEYGTKHVEKLDYLPCNCPVCSKHGAELKNLKNKKLTLELARHNLYATFTELDRVKQALIDGSLWELAALRCRAHPALYQAFLNLKNYSEWIASLDPITKGSAFNVTGQEAGWRSEVVNVKERIARVKSNNPVELAPFGDVPAELLEIYPFNTVTYSRDADSTIIPSVRDLARVRAIMDYQFGKGAGKLIKDGVLIKKSRRTKRIRWIYDGKEMIASVRASDHMILPKEKLAQDLLKKFRSPRLRVVLESDADVVACVREGKSVFAKFVKKVDPALRAGDECIIVDSKDNYVRVATLHLSPTEVKDFNYGMAARVR